MQNSTGLFLLDAEPADILDQWAASQVSAKPQQQRPPASRYTPQPKNLPKSQSALLADDRFRKIVSLIGSDVYPFLFRLEKMKTRALQRVHEVPR